MATDSSSQHWMETYKSLITLATEGFKFAALVNGGAAVALLAYLGNIASKGVVIPDMRCAMAFFLAGLAACGFSMLFAYLTQLALLDELRGKRQPKFSHHWVLCTGGLLFFASLTCFGVGSWRALLALQVA